MLKKHQNAYATFGLVFGALCWGVIWYPYRLMQEAGISGVASSLYTYLIAVVIVVLYFYKDLFKHTRAALHQPKSIISLSLVAGWTNLSYVLAIIDGEVMRVMLLFYLSPLWTLILAHFWLKERTNQRGLAVIALSLIGAFIMLWQTDALPMPNNKAEWLALSAGIGFALTNVITRHAAHLSVTTKSVTVWVGVIIVSLMFVAVQSLPFPNPFVMTMPQWGVMVLIALLLMAATFLVQYGITHIPVTRASVLFMFELVVAAVAAYYLTDETLTARECLGGGLIVLAALFAATTERA